MLRGVSEKRMKIFQNFTTFPFWLKIFIHFLPPKPSLKIFKYSSAWNENFIWPSISPWPTVLHVLSSTCTKKARNYLKTTLCLDDLVAMCKEFHGRVFKLEGDKWDLERGIKIRLLEVFFISVLPKVEVELSWKIKPPNGKMLSFIFRTLFLF